MSTDSIIQNYGGRVQNDLNRILNHIEEGDPSDLLSYPETLYVDLDGLTTHLTKQNDFNILSINIQSINAKYNELTLLLNDFITKGIKLGAICIQETWLDDNTNDNLFQIEGFKFISQGKAFSRNGGLAIYLDEQFEYKNIKLGVECTDWEYHCIEIFGGDICNEITICNVYRPPRHNNCNRVLSSFKQEFTKLVGDLSKNKNVCALAGDLNIDLLKINERSIICDFFLI